MSATARTYVEALILALELRTRFDIDEATVTIVTPEKPGQPYLVVVG